MKALEARSANGDGDLDSRYVRDKAVHRVCLKQLSLSTARMIHVLESTYALKMAINSYLEGSRKLSIFFLCSWTLNITRASLSHFTHCIVSIIIFISFHKYNTNL